MTTRRNIRMPALREKLGGVTRQAIYQWIKRRGFPKPLRLSHRVAIWDEAEVDKWMAQCR